MKKAWILGVLLLSACSSTSTPKVYYQLPSVPVAVSPGPTEVATAHRLWISQVNLADYLSSSGLVYQSSAVRYVTASNNLWASALNQQLQQALISNMHSSLPGWVVSMQPLGAATATLTLNVTAFHGRFDGKAVIQGEWILNQNGRVLRQPFNVELAQSDDGYDALVKTLAQGWQEVSQSIALQVARSANASAG